MTRQIKVRVWNGIEMVYDVVVGRFGAFYVNPGAKGDGLDKNDTASLTPFNTIYSKETPVMQFTGITCNGHEWYDGDILENDRDWYKIVYEDFDARWEAVGIKSTGEILSLSELVSSETWVQGNIYQNPELLK